MNSKRIITGIASAVIIGTEIIVNIAWDFVPTDKIKTLKDLFTYKSFWVFVASVVFLVFFNIYVNLPKSKGGMTPFKKRNWDKALEETEFYKHAAEKMGLCVDELDLKGCKKIKKMIDIVEK